MTRSRFVSELAALDARETRARYAAVLAAAKARAGTGRWADERLQIHVASAEASVLIAVRCAIASIEASMAWVDPKEKGQPLATMPTPT